MSRTRRSFFSALFIGAVAVYNTARHNSAEAAIDDDCERYSKELAAALRARHGGTWDCQIDEGGRFVMIFKKPDRTA